jgi:hypothetical protein
MKKLLTVIAAVVALGLATVAAPQPAQARHGWVAGGIIGGLAAGALIGAAAGPYYYGPGPYYYGPGPAYYAPGPCYWRRERIWNGYRWYWHRVRVCS